MLAVQGRSGFLPFFLRARHHEGQRGEVQMAERGARPQVPEWRLRAMRGVRSMFTPLLPDDYLELINPLWSTQELRGRVERVEPETDDAATIVIKPGWK